jgi:UDP-N-acetylmuramate dehydrogenase
MKHKKVDFSSYSSFKIGPILDVALLDECSYSHTNHYLLGACNNILIGEKVPPVMMLSKKYDFIKIEDNVLKIGAATPSGRVSSFCKKHNIANFEFLSHLPGKMGGLIFMNAGLKEYEIFNHIIDITFCSGVKKRDEVEYGYRKTNIDEPILEASFELSYGYEIQKVEMFQKMRSNQPATPSAGSCFKNPVGDYAGRLIEEVGLKGFRVGDMEFSKEHANFLVNNNKGSFDDAIWLIQEAQKRVYDKFGIWLECEIEVLDERYMGKDSPLLLEAKH